MLGGTWYLISLFLSTEDTPGKQVIFCTIYTTETDANWLQALSLPLSMHLQWYFAAPSIKRRGEYISPALESGLAVSFICWPCFGQQIKELVAWLRKLKEIVSVKYLAQGLAHSKSWLNGSNDHWECVCHKQHVRGRPLCSRDFGLHIFPLLFSPLPAHLLLAGPRCSQLMAYPAEGLAQSTLVL